MSKNRGKSKLSKNVLFNANKHVFHCEKLLGTFFYGQPSYIYTCMYIRCVLEEAKANIMSNNLFYPFDIQF
jgi:hypothetical protein